MRFIIQYVVQWRRRSDLKLSCEVGRINNYKKWYTAYLKCIYLQLCNTVASWCLGLDACVLTKNKVLLIHTCSLLVCPASCTRLWTIGSTWSNLAPPLSCVLLLQQRDTYSMGHSAALSHCIYLKGCCLLHCMNKLNVHTGCGSKLLSLYYCFRNNMHPAAAAFPFTLEVHSAYCC